MNKTHFLLPELWFKKTNRKGDYMRKPILLSLILSLTIVITFGQPVYNHYNFQTLYEPPGGFYDTEILRTIDIHFYEPNFDSILHQSWVHNTKLRLPAFISLCNGVSYDSVAIRYKGNSTYAIARDAGMRKLPFNIGMNNIIAGQNFFDIRKIKLANAIFDPTFAKEITAYHIFNQYTPSPQANLLKVNLQGDYIGLYVNTESINGRFLRKHFGEDDGAFFKCDPIQQFGQPYGQHFLSNLVWLGNDTTAYYESYDIKSDYGWTELRNLIYVINFAPHLMDSMLNIDRVLWNFALNTVTLELDKYNGIYQHNYYLYQTKDGRFQMIPWDLDNAFAGTLIAHLPDPAQVYGYDPFGGYSVGPRPLLDRLMANPLYKKIYTAHIRTLLEEVMIEQEVRSFVNDLQTLAFAAAVADTNKLFSMWCFNHNVENVYHIPGIIHTGGIMPSVINRKSFLMSHPEIMKTPPEILNVELFEDNETIYAAVEANNATRVSLRYSFDNHFVSLKMYDDGTHGDISAGDNIYTVALPKPNSGSIVKFYFLAENNEAIVLNPRKAENDYYFFVFSNIGGLYINEFMASNGNTIATEFGKYEDWIEIYNSTNQDIDLAGYFITDNLSNFYKYQIPVGYPETIIPAGGFLLIWADGEPHLGPLHTSFRLSASGEAVGLMHPDGVTIIDSITFGQQVRDVSYGRIKDGHSDWKFFNTPTPGASNHEKDIEEPPTTEDVTIFPNPANEKINIQTTETEFQIELINIYGQVVLKEKNTKEINVSKFSQGTYILRLSGEQFSIQRKVIIY